MIGANVFDDKDAPKMTGEEEFPILGRFVTVHKIHTMMHYCRGLNPYWDCLQKARIVQAVMKGGVVMLGSLYVWDDDMKANYGYEYNPPLEFHAWWQPARSSSIIIDLALPGVISRGMITFDHIGPIVKGREPAVMNGVPPKWCEYNRYEEYVDNGN